MVASNLQHTSVELLFDATALYQKLLKTLQIYYHPSDAEGPSAAAAVAQADDEARSCNTNT
jgi:hypothetical protein